MQPHRGVLILVLGILSFVACGPFLAVPAWIMGKGDLKRIDGGQMDPTGRDMTKIGMILGMVNTGLFIVGFVTFLLLMALGILGATRH